MSVLSPLPADDLEHALSGCKEVWPSLAGANIFVTGATGFFGRWMLESLAAANRRFHLGAQVVALSRDPEKFQREAPHLRDQPGLRWMRGSLTQLSAVPIFEAKFDAVIHLATEADNQATLSDPAAAVSVIADGTRHALELAVRTGARRFLFTSSGSVYGHPPCGVALLSEDFTGEPHVTGIENAYAISGAAKRQAEEFCAAYAREHGLEPVIARCFAFAGPGLPLDGKFAFGNFLRDALAGRPIEIKGDGTPLRSYLYAADLAEWLWTLLMRGAPGRIYNVGSENVISLRALAEVIAAELNAPGVTLAQRPAENAPPSCYVPSTARAREELGLREKIDLRDSVRRTAAWHRAAQRH